jgi:hypothetical protein
MSEQAMKTADDDVKSSPTISIETLQARQLSHARRNLVTMLVLVIFAITFLVVLEVGLL